MVLIFSMKKSHLYLTFGFLGVIFASPVFAASGTIAYKHSSCDYYIVSTGGDYALLEWYGGYDPDTGDTLVGDFESYGFKDIYDTTAGRETRVYVEDYFMSEDDVIEEYQDQCDGRYPILEDDSPTYYYVPPVVNLCAAYGLHSIPTIDKKCICAQGYEWNATMTSCVQSISCLNSIKRDNQCLSYTQDCQREFGMNTYGVKGIIENTSSCSCITGYEWNAGKTACVAVPQQSLSCSQYGVDAYLGADNNCYCKAGLQWNPMKTACIMIVPETPTQISPIVNTPPIAGTYVPSRKSPSLISKMMGLILLQVQAHGEAWYVNPSDSTRYYMPDGPAAYSLMRSSGLGIATNDLNRIPAVASPQEMQVSASVCSSNSLAFRMRGRILLQVQEHGEAWYIDPRKCKRIYMKDGDAAYQAMRFLGVGIADTDLERIPSSN